MLFIFTGFTSIGPCCSYFVIWTNILQGHNIAFYEPIKKSSEWKQIHLLLSGLKYPTLALCLLGSLLANLPTFPPSMHLGATLPPGYSVVKLASIPSQHALRDHPNALTLLYMGSALSRCHTFAYAVSLLEQSKHFLLSPPPVRSISSPSPASHDAQRSSIICTFYLATIFLTTKPRGFYILS